MHSLRRRAADERGETLAEVLMTISIMGILFAAVLGALAVSAQTSDTSKKEGATEALIRSYAEQIQDLSYVNCASTGAYTIAGFSVPTGYTVAPTAVRYWDGSNPAGFGAPCPNAASDKGVQAVDLRAQTADGRVNETMTLYKRAP
jgi:prepilin-type N-terminal cleavage/methylation domain-containing protein